MKRLKFIIWTICLLTLPCFIACDDDDEVYEIDMATVHESDGTFTLESDNFGNLIPSSNDLLTRNKVNVEGQRIMAYFQFNEEEGNKSSRSIKIYDLYKVLTKKLYEMPAEKEDSIGNNPVTVTSIYASHEHLNIFFTYLGNNSGIAHMVNLVTTEGSEPDAEGLLEVEFRHNKNGDIEAYPQSGWVSFELSSIPGYTDGTVKGLKVKVNNGDQIEKTYKISFPLTSSTTTENHTNPTLSFGSFSNTKAE